jgi:hypothetical protein
MRVDIVRFSLAAMVVAITGRAIFIAAAMTVSDEDRIRAVIESVDPATPAGFVAGLAKRNGNRHRWTGTADLRATEAWRSRGRDLSGSLGGGTRQTWFLSSIGADGTEDKLC